MKKKKEESQEMKAIKEYLTKVIQAEIVRLRSDGVTQVNIAERTGTTQPFIANFLNDNKEGMNGRISAEKLMEMAVGLGLKVDVRCFARPAGKKSVAA